MVGMTPKFAVADATDHEAYFSIKHGLLMFFDVYWMTSFQPIEVLANPVCLGRVP